MRRVAMQLALAFLEPSPPARPSPSQKLDAETRAEALNILARIIAQAWGVLYKIDGTSGEVGRIVWRMDPKQERQDRNRGAALWGNLVITAANLPPRIIATNKETGRVILGTGISDTPGVALTSAPLAIKDKIVIGAAGGDQGVRDWMAALDAAT